jgi:hypothetical protein
MHILHTAAHKKYGFQWLRNISFNTEALLYRNQVQVCNSALVMAVAIGQNIMSTLY